MKNNANQLSSMGYTAILPAEEDWDNIPSEKINEYKRKVSLQHFCEISNEATYAVLIVNETKKGIKNYIGANTFAEIAIAFYFNKRIFLLNGIYEPFKDELLAWGAVSLNGSTDNIRTFN